MADFEEDDGIFDDDVDEDDTNEIQRSRRRRRRSNSKSEESVSDAISSNITRILEGLLKDYDKTERPGFKTGKCIAYSIDKVARWQNLIYPHPQTWRNPRKGRDQILQRSLAEP